MTLEIQQKIRNHLIDTKQEWEEHFSDKKVRFLLALAWQTSEREEKAKKILTWMNEALGNETLDDDDKDVLKRYKQLYNNWNENQKTYDGELDFGGSLLTLKELLEEWENPPKPALTEEQQQKLDNYDKLEKERDSYKGQLDKLQKELKNSHEQLDKLEKEIKG